MASGVVGIQRVSKGKLEDSRKLRKNMTPSESLLWEHLRNRKCGGFKFRRQQVIEGFIADFYCEQPQIVVEVDGGIHDDADAKKNDAHRETVFRARGITTIRFQNDQVNRHIESVVDQIAAACESNRKQSKLAEWERHRLVNSGSPFRSGEGQEVRSE
jgi:very-short-patch-repair endonuclease